MKKTQGFNFVIILGILLFFTTLFFTTRCNKPETIPPAVQTVSSVSANNSTSIKGSGVLPSDKSILPSGTKALPMPPSVPPPFGGPPTIFNPSVIDGTTTAAPSQTFSVIAKKLTGFVNPNYLPTTVTFEYGRVLSVGTMSNSIFNISQSAIPTIKLTGNQNYAVYSIARPLLNNTTYGFRIKAVNSLGTVYSNPVLFTTQGHRIGEIFGGGPIFYIDNSGQHGLVAANVDQGNYPYAITTVSNKTGADIGTGSANTKVIVSAQGSGNYAASICANLVLNGFTDWYLPSQAELYLMFTNLKTAGMGNLSGGIYWSSTEFGNNGTALGQNFLTGLQGNFNKTQLNRVRAIRAF